MVASALILILQPLAWSFERPGPRVHLKDFLLNSVGGIDSCIGDRLVFVHNIHTCVAWFFKEDIQNIQ